MKKKTKNILITTLVIVVLPLYSIGCILWVLSRPIVALSHLLMLNPHTALKEIKQWRRPYVSIKDLFI